MGLQNNDLMIMIFITAQDDFNSLILRKPAFKDALALDIIQVGFHSFNPLKLMLKFGFFFF